MGPGGSQKEVGLINGNQREADCVSKGELSGVGVLQQWEGLALKAVAPSPGEGGADCESPAGEGWFRG